MLRKRRRRPRKPKVYRIRVETYLVALAIAFALSVAVSRLSRAREVDYAMPHGFSAHDPTFFASAHALANPVAVAGNRVEILENGVGIYPPMLAAIAAAKKTIHLETYIFWSGEAASRFEAALSAKAREGVRVRILLDGVGSSTKLHREEVRKMREAGCVVDYFHPVKPWMLDSVNYRTHRRILVVDGKVGFTGGAGIADEWLGDADTPEHWRDTHVRVEGPVVALLQAAFQENWSEVRGETLGGEESFPQLSPAGRAQAQVISSSARAPSSATKLLYAVSISAARHRIYLSNSYFLPDRETVGLLVAAARRGVDVRVIVPGEVNDVPATKAAGRSRFGRLLEGGVRIYEYQPTMFHPKTLVVDGIFSTIGSTNFDNRSFRLNDELNLTVYDEEIAAGLERLFRKDLARSRPYTLAMWRARPWTTRTFEWIVLPFRREL